MKGRHRMALCLFIVVGLCIWSAGSGKGQRPSVAAPFRVPRQLPHGAQNPVRDGGSRGDMYAGNVVEYADAPTLFSQPKHPYTVGLLNCYLDVDGLRKKLESIEGVVPDLINPPSGCRFHPRCKHAMPICSAQEPRLEAVDEGHLVSCHLYGTTDERR